MRRVRAVLGPNGAGKTSLLRTVLGVAEPSPAKSSSAPGSAQATSPRPRSELSASDRVLDALRLTAGEMKAPPHAALAGAVRSGG
jgi:ABC-type molybdenum transport system ATPase subunit/photorepair protein PhrA